MNGEWVVDASIAAKWVLPEIGSEAALRLQGSRLFAPAFFDIECANILWKAMRRGELTAEQALARQEALRDAPVERLPDAALLPIAMRLATELRHPVYDCLYLAAAQLTGAPLASADRRLAQLAVAGVTVIALDDLP